MAENKDEIAVSLSSLKQFQGKMYEEIDKRISNNSDNDSTIPLATCDTDGATAEKAVATDDSYTLKKGAVIAIKFTNSNTASTPTLNINNTGAISIWYNNEVYTGNGNYIGAANRYTFYIYDGEYYVWAGQSVEFSTTYNVFKGATSDANGTSGLVTKPLSGEQDKYLKGDGTWGDAKLSTDAYTTVTINTSDWIANSSGGYMYTYTPTTALPYVHFDIDIALSTDQSAAKLQLASWTYIIGDGDITQTVSDGTTTAITFYAYTNQPTVALTVALHGLS